MGYASHLVARAALETLYERRYLLARAALGLYVDQLAVNLLWTPLFFGARNPVAALLDIGILAGLAGGMTWLFAGVDSTATWLCLPYLAWLGYATYLNYSIVRLNPQGGVDKSE